MAKETKGKNIIFLVISILSFIALFFLFAIFLKQNYWWILPSFFYLVFFIFRESKFRIREITDNLSLKNSNEIRIDFWR